jgi:hypothetical protein
MRLAATIPDALHVCPDCGNDVASGIRFDGLPRPCGRCKKPSAAPVQLVFIPIESLPQIHPLPPAGMTGSGVLVALGFGISLFIVIAIVQWLVQTL